jgi:putative ABC transport system permease protein
MRGNLSSGIKSGRLRKLLVIIQFTLSVLLIIGTLIVYRQLNYMKSKDLGYDREHLFTFQLRGGIKDHYYTLKEEWLKNPQVLNVTASMQSPLHMSSNSSGADWDGKDPDLDVLIGFSGVDYDFVETMKIVMLSGRTNSREYPSDMYNDSTGTFVVNEEVAKIMNVEDPVGMRLDFLGVKGRIIGMTKNFHFKSVREKIEPMALVLGPLVYLDWGIVRIAPGDLAKTMKGLEDTWNEVIPGGYPFEYSFVDDEIDQLYRSEERLGKLLKYFTILAIIIACLGLFGLASFMAEQRTQEIGIRKVMGARVITIIMLLLKEFSLLVIIACILACPTAWYIMKNLFLQNFEYRVSIGWWIFLVSSVSALLISILTVSYQAARAALTNPAEALRYE